MGMRYAIGIDYAERIEEATVGKVEIGLLALPDSHLTVSALECKAIISEQDIK